MPLIDRKPSPRERMEQPSAEEQARRRMLRAALEVARLDDLCDAVEVEIAGRASAGMVNLRTAARLTKMSNEIGRIAWPHLEAK